MDSKGRMKDSRRPRLLRAKLRRPFSLTTAKKAPACSVFFFFTGKTARQSLIHLRGLPLSTFIFRIVSYSLSLNLKRKAIHTFFPSASQNKEGILLNSTTTYSQHKVRNFPFRCRAFKPSVTQIYWQLSWPFSPGTKVIGLQSLSQ